MRGVVKMVENMTEDEGIRSLKLSNRKNESVLLHDNDSVTGVSNDQEDDEEDSEEEWDEDELQETISDMKSDHVVMNENEDVQDEDTSDEFVEGDDEFSEVVPSEKKWRSRRMIHPLHERQEALKPTHRWWREVSNTVESRDYFWLE